MSRIAFDDGDTDDSMPDVLASAVREQSPLGEAKAEDVRRIMSAVHGARRRRRIRTWSLASGLVAASILAIATQATIRNGSNGESAGVEYVEFEFPATDARVLSVVGDFNAWDVDATPMTRSTETGRWVARVALPPGRYLYAFVVDNDRWLRDPHAPLAPRDDFARVNSVLVVGNSPAVR